METGYSATLFIFRKKGKGMDNSARKRILDLTAIALVITLAGIAIRVVYMVYTAHDPKEAFGIYWVFMFLGLFNLAFLTSVLAARHEFKKKLEGQDDKPQN